MLKLEANGLKSVRNSLEDHRTRSRTDFIPTSKRTMTLSTSPSNKKWSECLYEKSPTNSQLYQRLNSANAKMDSNLSHRSEKLISRSRKSMKSLTSSAKASFTFVRWSTWTKNGWILNTQKASKISIKTKTRSWLEISFTSPTNDLWSPSPKSNDNLFN